jgi:solute carrier family 25 aspartate/glutamate transporter 12/13
MSKATAVKEAVKETLIGAEEPVQLSTQTRARFNQNAIQDAASGDLFLGEEQFINAVAPLTEDYVSTSSPNSRKPSSRELR